MEVRGVNELLAKLGRVKAHALGIKMVSAGCEMVQHNVRTKQMAHQSGPPLPNKITARHGGSGLSGAIQFQVEESGSEITGHIGVSQQSDAAKYAKVHEFGGTIPHPGGRRDQMMGGAAVSVMPERPYLRPGLADEFPAIRQKWGRMVETGLREAGLR
jgi:hypothetical protein